MRTELSGGFYLDEYEKLLADMEADPKPKILLGVSYALWDLAEKYAPKLTDTIVMETGGMKGYREELPKAEFHRILTDAFGVEKIHSEYGMADIETILPSAKTYKGRVVWEIPSMTNDTTLVEVSVTASDTKEVSNSHTIILKAAGGSSSLLPERSGITIWSPASGKQDAFSFTTLQTLYSSETEECDLIFLPTEEIDALPKNWSTKTDIVFCKANNFDYTSATWSNIQEVFKSSLRTKIVEDIAIDDVIFVGREKTTEDGSYILTTLGVIKIMAMYDEDGTATDRIVFNLKTLPNV